VPILNGFWSKELILEIGLEHSPVWMYALMLGAGLTAFYTFRMMWLVFFGEARDPLHAHSTGSAMRVSLGILAGGTFLTWLLFERLNWLLFSTLPFHTLDHESLTHMVRTISFAPATWFALAIVALGFGLAWMRARGSHFSEVRWLHPLVNSSFGFEWINQLVVRGTHQFAAQLSTLQTGELNWNIFGIIGALLAVLIVLWLGA
jgi:NADH-quinone oxidoreductase subunit L